MPTPREVWSAGDWPSLSKLVVAPGEATAAAADVGPGTKAPDVGAGDGNVAMPLAKALEAAGRWDDLRAAARANFERFNDATDGTFRASPSYFRISA